VLGAESKLDCWSKLDTLLSHLQSTEVSSWCKSVTDKVNAAVDILKEICEQEQDVCIDDSEDEAKFSRVVKFCCQQLRLLVMKQTRYPVDFLRWAFQAFSLSPSTYLFAYAVVLF